MDPFVARLGRSGFALTGPDGHTVRYGDGPPKFQLRVNRAAAIGQCFANPLFGLPDAHVSGGLDIQGDTQELLRRWYRQRPSRWRLGTAIIAGLWRSPALAEARRNNRHHYDLGNDFFASWLDRRMVYSCARFANEDEGIEDAQARKLEQICRTLGLQPTHRLLDIGCGWGALAVHAAEAHGARVVGLTLSPQQRDFAQAMARSCGLADAIEIRLQDYRDLGRGDVFDRVASVGMIEHVGRRAIPGYMRAIRTLLRPDGLGVFQVIGPSRRGYASAWLVRQVFAGMYLPTLDELYRAMAQARLSVTRVENLRSHFALTFDAWASRFEQAAPAVAATHGDAFVRLWRLYLNASALAFKHGSLNLWEMSFTHEGSPPGLTRR